MTPPKDLTVAPKALTVAPKALTVAPKALVCLWSPYRGTLPANTLRDSLIEAEASTLAAEIPDGQSPVAALGSAALDVRRHEAGETTWLKYMRQNGGSRWCRVEAIDVPLTEELPGAEVNEKGVLTVDPQVPSDIAEILAEKYHLYATTIPGSKLSTFMLREFRRRRGIAITDAGGAFLVPLEFAGGLDAISRAVAGWGALLAVLPVPDLSIFGPAILGALEREVAAALDDAKVVAEKARAAAAGQGRIRTAGEVGTLKVLEELGGKVALWAPELAEQAAASALANSLFNSKAEIKSAYRAALSYRRDKFDAHQKVLETEKTAEKAAQENA